jgi:hypothetical protein
MAQQAFNSCMILLLDALECRAITAGAMKTEKAFVVFQDLQNVHTLATLAVERISWGLKKLHDVTRSAAGSSASRDYQVNDADMQGTWSEAMRGTHAMCEDTVMNATGMFLLEEPGLQGFVPEAFAPIAWNLGGVESPVPFHPKGEREFPQGHGIMDSPGSGDDTEGFRSARDMQGIRRSTTMRSAPTRYATPALDDRQPQSVTAPTSHTNSTMPIEQYRDPQAAHRGTSHHAARPLHLQHTQLGADNSNQWDITAVPNTDGKRQSHYAGGFPGLHRYPTAQMRHNSCPTLHQPVPAAPLQRPTYSSPTASKGQPLMTKQQPLPEPTGVSDQASFQDYFEAIPQLTSPDTSPDSQLSWTVRAAARSAPFQTQDPALDCVLPFHLGQITPGHGQGTGHEQSPTASYPVQFSDGSLMGTPLGTEQMSIDEWRRWIGSSGAE